MTERITAFQGTRVQGSLPPQRFQFTPIDLPNIVRGLTVPPPPPTRTPPASDATVARVERTALDQPLRGAAGTVERSGSRTTRRPGQAGRSWRRRRKRDPRPADHAQGPARREHHQGVDAKKELKEIKGGGGDALQRLDALEKVKGGDDLKQKARDSVLRNPVAVQQIIDVLTNASTESAGRLGVAAEALQFLSTANKNKVKSQVPESQIDQIADAAVKSKVKL